MSEKFHLNTTVGEQPADVAIAAVTIADHTTSPETMPSTGGDSDMAVWGLLAAGSA